MSIAEQPRAYRTRSGISVHQWPEPPVRRGTNDGTSTADSPPVAPRALLVHGLTSSWQTWFPVAGPLRELGWQVFALDLPGHGASRRAGPSLTLEDLGASVAAVIGQLQQEPLGPATTTTAPIELLVGHSLGALAVLAALQDNPDLAQRVVLEEPPPVAGTDWQRLAVSLESDTRLARENPSDLAAKWQAAGQGDVSTRKLEELRDCDGPGVGAALRRMVGVDAAPMEPETLARAAAVPLLLLLGEQERGSVLTGVRRDTMLQAPAWQEVVVLPTGHSVHADAPLAYVHALTAWSSGADRPIG